MKQDFYRGQIHGNHKFIKGSPRTTKDAFGYDYMPEGDRAADKIVLIVVVICVAIAAIFL